jgi:hypothetical protein
MVQSHGRFWVKRKISMKIYLDIDGTMIHEKGEKARAIA